MKSKPEYAIKTIVPQEVYTNREEFLTSYYDAAILAKTRRSMSSLLLGMRRMGKTEIFKRVVTDYFLNKTIRIPMLRFLFSFTFQMKQLHVTVLH